MRVIKSRRIRWAVHVERMDDKMGCVGSWRRNQKERDHWVDLGIDGWIVLRWLSRRWDVGIWTGLAQDRDRWRTIVSAVMNLQVP